MVTQSVLKLIFPWAIQDNVNNCYQKHKDFKKMSLLTYMTLKANVK